VTPTTDRPVLRVRPEGPGWRGWCDDHGPLAVLWSSQVYASLDVLGHGTVFHTRPRPHADAPCCWVCLSPATGFRDLTDGGAISVCATHQHGPEPGTVQP